MKWKKGNLPAAFETGRQLLDDRTVLSGRDVELGALGSSDSTILWPLLLMIAGVTVLALIGHFAFRRDSRIRPQTDFETVETFDFFAEFEGFDRPGGINPVMDSSSVAAGERAPTGPQ